MVYQARAFLFFLFIHDTLFALRLAVCTWSLRVTMERLAPPVVAGPKHFAAFLTDVLTPLLF